MVTYFAGRYIVEEFLGTFYLCHFCALQVHRQHTAFGLCYKEDVLYTHVVVESDSPVRGILAHWRRYLERTWQTCIDTDLICLVKVFGKLSLSLAVRKHIVQDMLLCLISLFKWLAVLLLGEDAGIILLLRAVIGNMLYNHRRLLVFNQTYHVADKLFWVVLELI